jgi:peptidoglycan/xylan/chitin deacetylase (PgdA/CDA1 family)
MHSSRLQFLPWPVKVITMRKIFLLSFDDGTVHDRRFVELLNRHGIPCTFNLNSGLEDFVWEFEGNPVRRQRLADTVQQYRGHEIASHTLHHPWLNSLDEEELRKEVKEDCENLKQIFGVEELGFGVPFTACGHREVAVIAPYVRYIRLSEFGEDFALPRDPYHIPIHALYHDPDVRDKIASFAADPGENALFVMAGHSYELEFLNHWEYMEDLLKYIKSFDFELLTTMDFVNRCYPQNS